MPTDDSRKLCVPTRIRVRYADTDQMHIVYNGKYLEYFEVGRTEMMREIGLPYSVFEQEGYMLPLIEAHCRFHAPARYDDLLVIESSLEFPIRSVLRIDYRITRDGEETLLTTGYTSHAFVLRQTSRPVRPPSFFLDAVEAGVPGKP